MKNSEKAFNVTLSRIAQACVIPFYTLKLNYPLENSHFIATLMVNSIEFTQRGKTV